MADTTKRNRAGLPGRWRRTFVRPENYAIQDGDTIELTNGFTLAGKRLIHLHGIDAPEVGQILRVTEELTGYKPFITVAGERIRPKLGEDLEIGTLAKKHLEALCDGQPIEIYDMFWDRFYTPPDPDTPDKRQTGNLYAEVRAWSREYGQASGTHLNYSMILAGMARVHTLYDDAHLRTEAYARKRKAQMSNRRTGLWAFLKGDDEEFSPRAWRREQRMKTPGP